MEMSERDPKYLSGLLASSVPQALLGIMVGLVVALVEVKSKTCLLRGIYIYLIYIYIGREL